MPTSNVTTSVTPLNMPPKRIVHTVTRPAYLDHEPVSHQVQPQQSDDNAKRRRARRNGWTNRKAA